MMANEPLSDERLAEINGLTATVFGATIHVNFDEATAWFAILDLRREVDRLRAREAATMAIVRKVAESDGSADSAVDSFAWFCIFCGHEGKERPAGVTKQIEHAPDCPVTIARSLLAQQ